MSGEETNGGTAPPTQAARLMELMGGSIEAYGTYDPHRGQMIPGTKIEIKSSARTLRGRVDLARWTAHVEGREPLGVIPLREDDCVVWGCVDVDKYDLDLAALCRRVEELGLPLIVGRSKSGGAHVFLFLREPAEAARVIKYLRVVRTKLGLGDSEIFPKQSRLHRDKGDVGNWMIVPYFGDTMPCLRPSGAELTLEEFLRAAHKARVSPDDLEDQEQQREQTTRVGNAGPVKDGPPCLQHLAENGFPEHSRNKGLFALGVYCKKRWPDDWRTHLDEMNHQFMKPPLSTDEMTDLQKSLSKKEYSYTCSETPLSTHCNANLCKTRQFGVVDRKDLPTITGISVLETDPVVWFVDIDDEYRLELSTQDLREYHRFQEACIEKIYKVFPPMKSTVWLEQVANAMTSVVRIEASPEVALHGPLREVVGDYLTNKWRGRRREDLLENRPWEDEEEKRFYFKMSNLMKHIRTEGLTTYTQSTVVSWVRGEGGGPHFFNIKGHGWRGWWLPSGLYQPIPETEPPPLEKEVM